MNKKMKKTALLQKNDSTVKGTQIRCSEKQQAARDKEFRRFSEEFPCASHVLDYLNGNNRLELFLSKNIGKIIFRLDLCERDFRNVKNAVININSVNVVAHPVQS